MSYSIQFYFYIISNKSVSRCYVSTKSDVKTHPYKRHIEKHQKKRRDLEKAADLKLAFLFLLIMIFFLLQNPILRKISNIKNNFAGWLFYIYVVKVFIEWHSNTSVSKKYSGLFQCYNKNM